MSRGTLYVLATPLGNLSDLSERAREVLRGVDLVAAEDTRRSRTLLAHLGASPEVLSVHAHVSAARLERVVAALVAGRSVALVTDAGTPAIADPGAELVRRARDAGVPVSAVPGPSAVTAALSISGLPADRYTFAGFAPRSGSGRQRLLDTVAASEWPVVLFEAPTRLTRLLEDLASLAGGDRPAAVARELTKVHEECRVGTLDFLLGYYRANAPRGEVTVVLAGKAHAVEPVDAEVIARRARALLREGLSRRDAAERLAQELPVTRNAAYRLVTTL